MPYFAVLNSLFFKMNVQKRKVMKAILLDFYWQFLSYKLSIYQPVLSKMASRSKITTLKLMSTLDNNLVAGM